jgi:hypothetical protein
MVFHMMAPLSSVSLFSVVMEDIIFSIEVSMAANVAPPLLLALAFMFPIRHPSRLTGR